MSVLSVPSVGYPIDFVSKLARVAEPAYLKASWMPTRLPTPVRIDAVTESTALPARWEEWWDFLIENPQFHCLKITLDTCPIDLLDLLEGEDLLDLAREVVPSEANPFLGRKHGNRGTYSSGCHGPLCKSANTAYYRERNSTAEHSPGSHDLVREKVLGRLGELYRASLEDMKSLRDWRIKAWNEGELPVSGPKWSTVDLKATILLDATDY